MANSVPLRAMIVIVSIIIAVVAAFYASLLPEFPMFSWASKAVPALSSLTAKYQDSSKNLAMPQRAPVYFLSHGGVRFYISKIKPLGRQSIVL
jgi:hypothetical protein